MSDLPKPVAFLLSGRGYSFTQTNPASADQKDRWELADEPLFTEPQLREYAAKCVEAERAKHAALVEAAQEFVRAYEAEHRFSSTGSMFHCIRTRKALDAYEDAQK